MLFTKKVIFLAKYLNFISIFLEKLAIKLPKYLKNNKYIITWKIGKESYYKLIDSLKPVKLEIFKIYIKTNLANIFIQTSQFSIEAFILFAIKLNINFFLYISF